MAVLNRPKTLFLDIDGVLNGHEKHADSPYTTIRPDCIQRLNKVIKDTGCVLVISSAWRYMMLGPNPPMTAVGFQYMLQSHGLVGTVKGFTCADETIRDREAQILQYVEAQKLLPRDWIVVDDLPLDFREYQNRFVRTDRDKGLQDKDVETLISILETGSR